MATQELVTKNDDEAELLCKEMTALDQQISAQQFQLHQRETVRRLAANMGEDHIEDVEMNDDGHSEKSEDERATVTDIMATANESCDRHVTMTGALKTSNHFSGCTSVDASNLLALHIARNDIGVAAATLFEFKNIKIASIGEVCDANLSDFKMPTIDIARKLERLTGDTGDVNGANTTKLPDTFEKRRQKQKLTEFKSPTMAPTLKAKARGDATQINTNLSTSTGSSSSSKSAADTNDNLLSILKVKGALLSGHKKGVRAMAAINKSGDFEFVLIYKPRYDGGISSNPNDTMADASKMPNATEKGARTPIGDANSNGDAHNAHNDATIKADELDELDLTHTDVMPAIDANKMKSAELKLPEQLKSDEKDDAHETQEIITDGSNLLSHERGTVPTKSATESPLSPSTALTAERRELMLKPTTMECTQSEPLKMIGRTTPQSGADIDKAERSRTDEAIDADELREMKPTFELNNIESKRAKQHSPAPRASQKATPRARTGQSVAGDYYLAVHEHSRTEGRRQSSNGRSAAATTKAAKHGTKSKFESCEES